MERTVQINPLLRPAAALAAGIAAGLYTDIPLIISGIAALCFLFSALILNLNYKFCMEKAFGILLLLAFFASGLLLHDVFNQKKDSIATASWYIGTVYEAPRTSPGSYSTVLSLTLAVDKDTIVFLNEKIAAYFEKNSKTSGIRPNDQIVFKGTVRAVKNNGNPYAFNYTKYLELKRIYRQVYIKGDDWYKTELISGSLFNTVIGKLRENFLTHLQSSLNHPDDSGILSALILGYRQNLEPAVLQVFTSTGAMHVLAVSGLHVGIVYGIIWIIFGFIRKKRTGRIVFVISSVLLLWGYAFITGLPVSVIRAVTMLSIVIAGQNLNRHSRSFNTLALSGMLILIINPNSLFSLGFLLSYAAVAGILVFQPVIFKIVKIRYRIVLILWTMLTVSIAAQAATLPLTLHHFNLFPSYFWLTNFILVPAVMVLVILGFALLFLASFPIVCQVISFTIHLVIKYTLLIMKGIDLLPLSSPEFHLHTIEIAFLAGIIFSCFFLIRKFNPATLKAVLFFIFLFQLSSLYLKMKRTFSKEFIIYNTRENMILHVMNGMDNIVISATTCTGNDRIQEMISATVNNLKLNEPNYFSQSDSILKSWIIMKDKMIHFEDRILFLNQNSIWIHKIGLHSYHSENKSNTNFIKKVIRPVNVVTNRSDFPLINGKVYRTYNVTKRGSYREKL